MIRPAPVFSGASGDAVALIDKRHDFIQQEIRIALALRPEDGWMHDRYGRYSLATVLLRVVDANDDERRNFAFADQSGRSLVHLPVDSDVCRRGINRFCPSLR